MLNLGDARSGSKGKYHFRIGVMQREYVQGMDMEAIYLEAYDYILTEYPEREFARQDTRLAGKPAVQFTLERPSGEPWWRVRDTWVVHHDHIYIITYWSFPGRFEDGLQYYESVLASVRIFE